MPLDPRAKQFLERLAALSPPRSLTPTLSERRSVLQQLLSLSGQGEPVQFVEQRALPGPAGAVQLRIYTPLNAAPTSPGLIYFHGGGLVAGSLDTHDAMCRSLCNASACRVLSVDYRLAPEHPYPAALEDGHAAVLWIAAHHRELGIDPHRIVIGGDSAGGTLAAVLCQMLAADGQVRVALQVLLCPLTDYGADTESRTAFAQGFLIDRTTLQQDLQLYLGAHVDASEPRVSPLRALEFRGLPPACIHTAEFDPVRDEGAAYAQRLQQAGVETRYRCHSGMIHLFFGMGTLLPYAATGYQLIGDDIRSMLGCAKGTQ